VVEGDTSVGNHRRMFVQEPVPLVDRVYRTIPDRGHRGLSGVSMGGQGAFTVGLSYPGLFSSIASHMGALTPAPLAGLATATTLIGARPLPRQWLCDEAGEDLPSGVEGVRSVRRAMDRFECRRYGDLYGFLTPRILKC
jgi:poly(3-hydroxybutyrate) depolymerase